MSIPIALLALTFGNPAILWGLVLMVAPLLLHLLFRRTQQIEPWGAMRFLQAAIRRRRQRLRLESLLQLAVRSLLLGIIVLAAADPRTSATTDGMESLRQVHRLLVLDTSLSTQATDGTQSAFSRMIRMAEQIVAESSPGDSFQVLQSTQNIPRTIISQPSFDKASVLNEIQLMEPTYDQGDLVATLREARTLVESAPADSKTEILILGDFQTREWMNPNDQPQPGLRDLVAEFCARSDIRLLDTGVEPVANSSLVKLSMSRPWVFATQPVRFTFEVRHDGTAESVIADIQVDEAPHSRQQVKLVQGQGTGSATITFLTPGEHAVAVVLSEDGLAADNRLLKTVNVRRSLHILLTANADHTGTSTDYIQTALTLGESLADLTAADQNAARFDVQSVALKDLGQSDLNQVDCLILRNPAALPIEDVRKIAGFVKNGGGLIIAPDVLTNLTTLNSLLADVAALAPIRFEEGDSTAAVLNVPEFFETDMPEHPILLPFEGYPDAGFKTTRVYKYFPVASVDPAAWVVVRLPSGAPIMAERDFGRGRVLQTAIPFEPEWTSWVVWPSFIPMLHQGVQHVSEGRVKVPDLVVGENFDWELSESASATDLRLARPDGEVILPSSSQEGGKRISFSEITMPGAYHLIHAADKRAMAMTAQIPDSETVLTYIPPSRIVSSVLSGLPIRVGSSQGANFKGDLLSGMGGARSPGRITKSLLFLAGLLMLTDVLASRSLPIAGLCLLAGLSWLFLLPLTGLSPVSAALVLGMVVLLTLLISGERQKRLATIRLTGKSHSATPKRFP